MREIKETLSEGQKMFRKSKEQIEKDLKALMEEKAKYDAEEIEIQKIADEKLRKRGVLENKWKASQFQYAHGSPVYIRFMKWIDACVFNPLNMKPENIEKFGLTELFAEWERVAKKPVKQPTFNEQNELIE